MLTEPGHEGATYMLTGPAPITHAQIAVALTEALGREVTFTDCRPRRSRTACTGSCRPGRWMGCWRTTRTTGAVTPRRCPRRSPGSPAGPPIDVWQFARDYAPAFKG
jgi:hypothetical protein